MALGNTWAGIALVLTRKLASARVMKRAADASNRLGLTTTGNNRSMLACGWIKDAQDYTKRVYPGMENRFVIVGKTAQELDTQEALLATSQSTLEGWTLMGFLT